MAKSWRDRFACATDGVCEFLPNYRYFFKWLTSLVSSCYIIRGRAKSGSLNKEYLKRMLIINGFACITEFDGNLYSLDCTLGGRPDEYYIPSDLIIANPVLGSKIVHWRDFKDQKKNGVLICNTETDRFVANSESCGLYDLIHQTATMLADNIVSINCAQINSRVQNFVIAESDTQAETGEATLKKLYAGKPFAVLQSDVFEKISIQPAFSGSPSQNITEIVELHNYILSNFLKTIGVAANVVMKRERLITDEVNAQNDVVALNLTEMLESWQRGLNEVNELYADLIEEPFAVDINPAIVHVLFEMLASPPAAAPEGVSEEEAGPPEDNPEPAAEPEPEPEEGAEDAEVESKSDTEEDLAEEKQEASEVVEENLDEQAEAVAEIAEALSGDPDPEEGGEQNDNSAEDEDRGMETEESS